MIQTINKVNDFNNLITQLTTEITKANSSIFDKLYNCVLNTSITISTSEADKSKQLIVTYHKNTYNIQLNNRYKELEIFNTIKQDIYPLYRNIFYKPTNIQNYFDVYAVCVDLNSACNNIIEHLSHSSLEDL